MIHSFVRENIKSSPLDEEFVTFSLAFFNKMIIGRDWGEIVPEASKGDSTKHRS